MNKRIKELAEQSGLQPYYDAQEGQIEKFAELIIRECADIIQNHVMNISTYADAEFVEEQIQKHFGVEE